MKIAISFEGRVRPDSTGFYFLNAAKNMGHEVFHILPEHVSKMEYGDADLFLKIDDGLSDQVWNSSCHPSAYYVIDTHLDTDWRLKFANEGKFDAIYTAQSQGVRLPWDCKNVSWLPLGCDIENHYVGEREKLYDGCFIGNFHTQYASKRFKAVDEFFRHTPKPFFGARTYKEMAEKYAQSRIVFNQSINGDVNMRIFEALCSGSCLLTDRLEDLHKLGLVDGIHYVGYDDISELKRLCHDLLDNEDVREAIARNGRRIATQHTYGARLKTIIEALPKTQEKKHGLAVC